MTPRDHEIWDALYAAAFVAAAQRRANTMTFALSRKGAPIAACAHEARTVADAGLAAYHATVQS